MESGTSNTLFRKGKEVENGLRKIKAGFTMEYEKLNDLVHQEFGVANDWSCHMCWQCNNDTYVRIEVKKEIDSYDMDYLTCQLEGSEKAISSYMAPRLYMVELCKRNILPVGDYFVDVSW